MKYTLYNILFVFLLLLSACQQHSSQLEQELCQLDSVLDHRDDWVAKRQATIDQWRERLDHAASAEERYWTSKAIFEQYSDVNSDSSLVFAERNYQMARQNNDEHEQLYWQIQKGMILSVTGQLESADKILMSVRPLLKDSVLLWNYYNAMLSYSYMSAHYEKEQYYASSNNPLFKKEIAYRDSIIMMLPPNSEKSLNLRVWQYYFEKKTNRNYRPELKASVDNSKLDCVDNGMNAFMLAQTYNAEGNKEDYLKYLIKSAIAYVKSGATNIPTETFQELCQELMERGDIARAYVYINYCAENLSAYDNRVQAFRVAHLQNIIKDKNLQHERQQRQNLSVSAIVIGLLAVVLAIVLFLLFRQMRKVRYERSQLGKAYCDLNEQFSANQAIQQKLETANRQLAELNSRLQNTNEQLTEANFVKEEYIGYLFSICSTYLDKLDKQRKSIARKLKAGQLAELSNYTPGSMEAKNDLKEFYQSFDSVFLRIYPNFVHDINALMKDSEQITPRDEGHLNTDLRILALMRLGISDGEKIAEFLHCSVQSVYNSRRSVYGRLSISKEEFKEQILKLGDTVGND